VFKKWLLQNLELQIWHILYFHYISIGQNYYSSFKTTNRFLITTYFIPFLFCLLLFDTFGSLSSPQIIVTGRYRILELGWSVVAQACNPSYAGGED
jgi:hypothetical protein